MEETLEQKLEKVDKGETFMKGLTREETRKVVIDVHFACKRADASLKEYFSYLDSLRYRNN